MSFIKHEIRHFSHPSRAVKAKKCTKKACCTYKIVVFLILIVLVAVTVVEEGPLCLSAESSFHTPGLNMLFTRDFFISRYT